MRHATPALVGSLLILAACASAPPPSPPPSPPVVVVVATTATPPPVAPPPPAPLAPAPPLPASVGLSQPLACAFDAPRFEGAQNSTYLALSPAGKPFARINGGAARVSIPTGGASAVLLAIEDAGLFVQGHTAASAIALRPERAFVTSDFAIPTMYAELSLFEGAPGALTVTHEAPSELEVLSPPLRATRPCGDVGLEGGVFEAEAARADLDEKKKTAVKLIEPGQKVALRIAPQGKPVARIALKNATLVTVFESKGGMSRISVPVDTLLVFGWVKSSDLRQAGDMAGYGSGSGRGGARDPKWTPVERLRCDAEVPLMAEVGGERLVVGAIRKKTVIDVIERRGEVARVWVKSAAIHPVEGAELLVREADLRGCGTVAIEG